MGGSATGGSSSESSQRTNVHTYQTTGGDNSVVGLSVASKSNNQKWNVGRGAQVVFNSGVDGEQFFATVRGLGDTIANANAQNSKLLAAAVTARAADTITDPNDSGGNKLPVWLRPALLIGAGIVVLVVILKLFTRNP